MHPDLKRLLDCLIRHKHPAGTNPGALGTLVTQFLPEYHSWRGATSGHAREMLAYLGGTTPPDDILDGIRQAANSCERRSGG